jgi:DNA-binding response OmpR family regulator
MLPHILLIEGRSTGRRSWGPKLMEKGYAVTTVYTRRESQTQLESILPDLAVIDTRFLRFDAFRFCEALRDEWGDLPLLLILSHGEEMVRGVGVDIYLREPFTFRKLFNRVKRLLPAQSEKVLRVGEFALDLEQRTVTGASFSRRLTPKQANLLEVFLRHPGQVLPRSYLMKEVWNTDFVDDTRTLEVHVHWLRRAIEKEPSRPVYLTTVRGIGYRFDVPQSPITNGE